ncbi:MAG: TldD/PmbA family protein [Planctomycetota bacterium]
MDVNELFDTILGRAGARADAAEVYYESAESRPVEFENNKLKYIATKSGRGVGLRVVDGGRIGFSSTSDLSRLDELVDNALESARFGQDARFEFPESCESADVNVYDEKVPQLDTREMADLGHQAIDAIRVEHPDVQCSGSVNASVSEERVANTRGLDVGYTATTSSVSLTALSVDDDGFLWAGDRRSRANLIADAAPLVDKINRDLELAKETAAVSTGTYPAIFSPDAMATLLLSTAQGVNGKMVQKGASPLTDRVGEQILDERVTITDDALTEYGASSAPHDTEGLVSGRTALFENGVLCGYLFDLQTAGMLGERATGNGLRSYGSQPRPGHNNTLVAPGESSYDDMLAGIERGILVDSVLGGGMSNTLAGEFSVNVELGFLIENGRLAGRIKNCMIAGNAYELLKDGIDAIGDTPEMKGSLSVPHFCFKGIRLGTQ